MSNGSGYTPALWEKITVVTVSVGIVVLVGLLVVRNQRFADPNLVVILRIILSLAVAVLGATIPGFLQVDWSGQGVAIRAGGALALFIVTFLLSPKVVQEQHTGQSGATDSKLELVEATFPEPDGKAQRGQATLDVKVRNVGGKSAFLKRADFRIRKKWLLKPVTLRWQPIPPSEEYFIVMPEKQAPFLVSKPISQEVGAGGVDRFLFTFYCQDDRNATVYLVDVEFIYDEDNKTLHKDSLIFLIPGANDYTGRPDKGDVQAQEAVKHNQQVAAEVSAERGETSSQLKKMLEAIKTNKS